MPARRSRAVSAIEFELPEAPVRRRRHRRDRRPAAAGDARRCARDADAVLLGAVGGPKWSDPNAACDRSRDSWGCARNWALSPICAPSCRTRAALDASPLKAELLRGVDMHGRARTHRAASISATETRTADLGNGSLCRLHGAEVERIVRVAGRLARARRREVCLGRQGERLETSRLWREVTTRVLRDEFPDVQLEHHAGRCGGDAPATPRRAIST